MVDEWLDPPEHENPKCPVCGEECETLYRDDLEIVGCEHCIKEIDAYEYMESEKEIAKYG
jgi:ribosomal protein L37AE/L43A